MTTSTLHTIQALCLNRQSVLALIMLTAFPHAAMSAVGRVEFAIGNVTASSANGTEKNLIKNMEINSGDTIQTLEGRAQLRFEDGGYISLQPNTQFKVEDYHYSGKADGSEKGFFQLLKGGLRAISGAIGKSNKQAYRLNTPVATVGIRGTEFLTQLVGTRLLVKVGDGAVYISNAGGDLILYKGQTGEVSGLNNKPQHSAEEMKVSAAGPNGATPDDTQKDQQSQNEEQSVFKLGEIQDNTGEGSCSVVAGCALSGLTSLDQLKALFNGPVSNLAQLSALGAGAVYTGATTITFNCDCYSPATANADQTLIVDFANYSSAFVIQTAAFTGSNSLAGKTLVGTATGNLDSSGVFAFSPGTTQVFSGNTAQGSGGTLNVTSASLNSSNLSQAKISYNLTDGQGEFANQTAALNGTVFAVSSAK